ncbi:MFS transporter [Hyphobacterium marinum]|uniref:MFS transporter n=1 Tax=Hyphobacterium marinum TaxID=3116574 RepID=A0ABU7M0I5_9PROT|nr:MFS transporter [Hyphobacterium sp. Y6023]MEE2567211.1 MFS transporter [Hyphobacterium sp. Y6023]
MSAKVAVSLLGQRRYLPLLIAQALGAFNDNFFRYALITLVTYRSMTVLDLPSTVLVPIAASLFTAPIFLFSAMAGRVADVFDRTRVLRFTKFAEIWLMLLAGTGFVLGNPWILMGTLFLMGIQSAFFAPAKNAALPTLLAPHELVPGNALISGSLNLAVLVGVGFGTVLVVQHNGPATVAAILVVIAVIGWLSARMLPAAPAATPGLQVSFNFIGELVSVLWRATRHPDVLRPLIGAAWFWMLAASIVTLMPNFSRDVLGADQSVVLLFSALFSVGATIGAVLCGTLSGKGDALPFSVAGAIGLVIFPLDVAWQTMGNPPVAEDAVLASSTEFLADSSNWRIIADLGLAAVSAGLFVVPLQAMAQRRAPAQLRGRLLAAGGILNAATATLGQATLAILAMMSLPIPTAFILIAVVSAGFGAVTFWRWWIGHRGRTLEA